MKLSDCGEGKVVKGAKEAAATARSFISCNLNQTISNLFSLKKSKNQKNVRKRKFSASSKADSLIFMSKKRDSLVKSLNKES